MLISAIGSFPPSGSNPISFIKMSSISYSTS
nr:MAG TPA: hypothetical protein [Caudoviricetes sp.]